MTISSGTILIATASSAVDIAIVLFYPGFPENKSNPPPYRHTIAFQPQKTPFTGHIIFRRFIGRFIERTIGLEIHLGLDRSADHRPGDREGLRQRLAEHFHRDHEEGHLNAAARVGEHQLHVPVLTDLRPPRNLRLGERPAELPHARELRRPGQHHLRRPRAGPVILLPRRQLDRQRAVGSRRLEVPILVGIHPTGRPAGLPRASYHRKTHPLNGQPVLRLPAEIDKGPRSMWNGAATTFSVGSAPYET